MHKVQDMLGNEIVAGQTVVYPVRRKSELTLKRMKVTQVQQGQITGYSPTGRITHITNLHTVAVAKQPQVHF